MIISYRMTHEEMPRPERAQWKDVHGQEVAKRAIEVALCGPHPIVFTGSPSTPREAIVTIGYDLACELEIPFDGTAMLPCPCGWYGSTEHKCFCKPEALLEHRNNTDIPANALHVELTTPIAAEVLSRYREEAIERVMQSIIGANERDKVSQQITDTATQEIFKTACEELTIAAVFPTLPIAATIARMNAAKSITLEALCEALHYRKLYL